MRMVKGVTHLRGCPSRTDALLAVGVAALAVTCVVTEPITGAEPYGPAPGGAAVVLGMCLPLAWRRSAPLLALAVSASFGLLSTLGTWPTEPADLFLQFGLGSAALYTNRRTTVLLMPPAIAYQLATWVVSRDSGFDLARTVSVAAWALIPLLVGDAMRTQRACAAALARDAAQRARLHQLEVACAAEQERLRIAGELHDIVGHYVSAIGIQARAVATIIETDRVRAARGARQIAKLADAALDESRESVGMLRDPAAEMPQPRLDQVDRLADAARAGGVSVTVVREGAPRPLLDAVERCGYRVVQEALTNVVKHAAAPAGASVALGFHPHALTVSVRSDGPVARAADRGGTGIDGMRDRVELVGGRLEAGPGPHGGWLVSATIPLEA